MGGANYVRNLAEAIRVASPSTRITYLVGEPLASDWTDVAPRALIASKPGLIRQWTSGARSMAGAMKKAGVWLGGDRLKTTRHAARVRVRDGKSVVLDGPYVDAKEQVGGYYIIDVPSIDEAIEWAVRSPAARFATVDVRPLAEIPR